MTARPFCTNPFDRVRRRTSEVRVGNVGVGGDHPIVVQSMLTSDTMKTEACVEETLGLVDVGCQIVRITAPTVKDAANLEKIVAELRARGCQVPIVADIHFKPQAAMEAAKWVQKVRINPGNYADSKKFNIREYTDEEYDAELDRIRERFTPLVEYCRDRQIAMRIGTNHGSLSDRIMNRYGDSPIGMVESALEFARIAHDLDYHAVVFSMKASNPKVMIAAYRFLVQRLDELGWDSPIHLGVTEAGDGEDGRIKSAIGIGSLLADGIGDTLRGSLTEDSVHEIPVARTLVDLVQSLPKTNLPADLEPLPFDPIDYSRRPSHPVRVGEVEAGGENLIRVCVRKQTYDQLAHKLDRLGDYQPEFQLEASHVMAVDPSDTATIDALNRTDEPHLVTIQDGVRLPVITAYRLLAARLEPRHPILLKDTFFPPTESPSDFDRTLLTAAMNIGSLLCDGIGDAILIQSEPAPGQSVRLAYNILQAAGSRIFKTEYVACPSCGRTLFNLQETTARIRAATDHLKGVKIAVMGCIVNGPGEMADADFGYVGGAPGKVNLYVGKQPVKFNIPEAEAVDRLKDLIAEHGKWTEPAREPAPQA